MTDNIRCYLFLTPPSRTGYSNGSLLVSLQLISVNQRSTFLVCAAASLRLTLEERTSEGESFLTLAVTAGFVENVKMLLDYGASPHMTNSNNESPLLLGQTSTPSDLRGGSPPAGQ